MRNPDKQILAEFMPTTGAVWHQEEDEEGEGGGGGGCLARGFLSSKSWRRAPLAPVHNSYERHKQLLLSPLCKTAFGNTATWNLLRGNPREISLNGFSTPSSSILLFFFFYFFSYPIIYDWIDHII